MTAGEEGTPRRRPAHRRRGLGSGRTPVMCEETRGTAAQSLVSDSEAGVPLGEEGGDVVVEFAAAVGDQVVVEMVQKLVG